MKLHRYNKFIKESIDIDEDKVLDMMKKSGWGDSVVNNIEDFENSDYHNSPNDTDDYFVQFSEYMDNLSTGNI